MGTDNVILSKLCSQFLSKPSTGICPTANEDIRGKGGNSGLTSHHQQGHTETVRISELKGKRKS